MAWQTESIQSQRIEEVYIYDDEDRDATRSLIFRIEPRRQIVEHYLRDRWFPIEKVTYEGFVRPPDEVNERGFFKSRPALTTFRRKLEEVNAAELLISRQRDTGMRRTPAGRRLTLNYADFQEIVANIRTLARTQQADLRSTADSLFHDLIPRQFQPGNVSPRSRLNRLLGAMDDSVIPEMAAGEIDQLLDFTQTVLDKRYVVAERRRQLTGAAKLRIDQVALTQVISRFEQMLEGHHLEAAWGLFIKRNLYLIESRYVHILDRLNVITAGAREVDFGLVDTHSFLDIFEIKTPGTRLLASGTDRGNSYWHTDATKAIVQAEKYLYNAERRGTQLGADIQRELNTPVSVVRPRALLLIGSSTQLDTEAKREDFRVLRTSLRNVEVVLYDELLARLRNMRDKLS